MCNLRDLFSTKRTTYYSKNEASLIKIFTSSSNLMVTLGSAFSYFVDRSASRYAISAVRSPLLFVELMNSIYDSASSMTPYNNFDKIIPIKQSLFSRSSEAAS